MASGDDVGAAITRLCTAEGCSTDLSTEIRYCQQRRMCATHLKAPALRCKGGGDTLWRFCQQCGKLQRLCMFDGSRRSCRLALARRRASAAAAAAASSGTAAVRPSPGSSASSQRHASVASGSSSASLGSIAAPGLGGPPNGCMTAHPTAAGSDISQLLVQQQRAALTARHEQLLQMKLEAELELAQLHQQYAAQQQRLLLQQHGCEQQWQQCEQGWPHGLAGGPAPGHVASAAAPLRGTISLPLPVLQHSFDGPSSVARCRSSASQCLAPPLVAPCSAAAPDCCGSLAELQTPACDQGWQAGSSDCSSLAQLMDCGLLALEEVCEDQQEAQAEQLALSLLAHGSHGSSSSRSSSHSFASRGTCSSGFAPFLVQAAGSGPPDSAAPPQPLGTCCPGETFGVAAAGAAVAPVAAAAPHVTWEDADMDLDGCEADDTFEALLEMALLQAGADALTRAQTMVH